MIELAKFTFPVPSGKRMRLAYGNVIRGKIIEQIVFMTFNVAFFLSDLVCAIAFNKFLNLCK